MAPCCSKARVKRGQPPCSSIAGSTCAATLAQRLSRRCESGSTLRALASASRIDTASPMLSTDAFEADASLP
eukprot:5670047-Pyramimonas_sp.AAC.1